jgi:hypothetical protein
MRRDGSTRTRSAFGLKIRASRACGTRARTARRCSCIRRRTTRASRRPRWPVGPSLDELEGQGVAFEQYDQPGIKTDERGVFDTGSFRVVWVKDPDGNTLAINEDPAAR